MSVESLQAQAVRSAGDRSDSQDEVEVPPLPLDAEEFLTWLRVEKGRADNTLVSYRRDLLRYWRFLFCEVPPANTELALTEVTSAELNGFLRSLSEAGLAASSVVRTMVAVKGLHRFLAAEDVAESDPGADVEVPKVPAGLPKALTEAQVGELLDAVGDDDHYSLRDRAMLEVLYGTGLRISELVGLSLSDLDLEAALLRCFGKGGKERVVPLGRLARQALQQWLTLEGRGQLVPKHWRSRDDADAIFLNRRGGRLTRQGAWGIVEKRGRAVGLEDVLSPHVLRHSCATHMLNHGADIRSVQELLGHASITTTQVYTKVSNERLWQVYRESHPRAQG